MKRKISLVLALVVCLMAKAQTSGIWTSYKAANFSSIDIEKKTITITSADELALLAYYVYTDGTYRDYSVTLNNNLDMSGHFWIPIGSPDAEVPKYEFIGTFDGKGHTISNLDIWVKEAKDPEESEPGTDVTYNGNVAGLFGTIGSGGTVKDVFVSGTYVGVKNPTATCYIGGIAGINKGTIVGCANKGAPVNGNWDSARVGGIAGQNNGTIQNCYNLGEVYTSNNSSNYLGGIAGYNTRAVKNCFVRAIIDRDLKAFSRGKICGDGSGTVTGCFYANGLQTDPLYPEIRAFSDTDGNTGVISTAASAGSGQNILLDRRTLFTDGDWNTICLPFSIPAGAVGYSPIAGAQVKTLSSSSFAAGTLTLNFENATSIVAGKPYIVKWNTAIADNLANPVFMGVTVSSGTTSITTTNVDFIGSFSPVALTANDYTKLYLGSASTLYYPSENMTINSFRAYFVLKGIEAGTPSSPEIKSFVLNFDDDTTTGITTFAPTERAGEESWYDLSGRKMVKSSNRPISRGIYIRNGKKVVIK